MRVHIFSLLFLVHIGFSFCLKADDATKALLPIFGEPLKAAKLLKNLQHLPKLSWVVRYIMRSV